MVSRKKRDYQLRIFLNKRWNSYQMHLLMVDFLSKNQIILSCFEEKSISYCCYRDYLSLFEEQLTILVLLFQLDRITKKIKEMTNIIEQSSRRYLHDNVSILDFDVSKLIQVQVHVVDLDTSQLWLLKKR